MSKKFEPWLTEPTIWKGFIEESGIKEEHAKILVQFPAMHSRTRDHYDWFAKGFLHGGQS